MVARLTSFPRSEYDFLLGRYIDEATLARANAIALHWGVHPHEVMIANGWLAADDYYRALAERCGAPFKAKLSAVEVTPPATASPRQCLGRGVLKERDRARSFVLHPTASDLTHFAKCCGGFRPMTSRSPRPLR